MKFPRIVAHLSLGTVVVVAYSFPKSSNIGSRPITTVVANRRNFLEKALVSTAFVSSAVNIVLPVSSAFADGDTFEDDLSMPSEDEVKKQQEAELAERLRRKAELQKKVSRPLDFKESMKREKEMQDSLKKSQAEKRAAMCEELGRGC